MYMKHIFGEGGGKGGGDWRREKGARACNTCLCLRVGQGDRAGERDQAKLVDPRTCLQTHRQTDLSCHESSRIESSRAKPSQGE